MFQIAQDDELRAKNRTAAQIEARHKTLMRKKARSKRSSVDSESGSDSEPNSDDER